MKEEGYQVEAKNIYEYKFVSRGKKEITKIVQIAPLDIINVYNLGFGDLIAEDQVDDKVESNNQNFIKVIGTIGKIVFDFLAEKPEAIIFFGGSTKQRTRVYNMILKRNYRQLSKKYIISALIEKDSIKIEVEFGQTHNGEYLGFFIRNII